MLNLSKYANPRWFAFSCRLAILCGTLSASPLFAQGVPLADVNGDQQVSILAFGDSLTYGTGDGIAEGVFIEDVPEPSRPVGYPIRIETAISVPVQNVGVPGERISGNGVFRFPSAVANSPADLVVILEGTNDSIVRLDPGKYGRLLQKLVNVTRALGKLPVIATLPAPCCGHGGQASFTRLYSAVVRDTAAINRIPLSDTERAWDTTCVNKAKCELYNLPEGLHPNRVGYDVMAQTVLAALYGIDIFAADGAAQLESAAALPPGTVIVKPDL